MTINSINNQRNGRRILMPHEDLLTGGNNTGSIIMGST